LGAVELQASPVELWPATVILAEDGLAAVSMRWSLEPGRDGCTLGLDNMGRTGARTLVLCLCEAILVLLLDTPEYFDALG